MTGPVADLRREYGRDGLGEADLAPTWYEQLGRWLDDAVRAGSLEPNAMTLATADAQGRPSARTVLLKGLDARGLVLYTNRTSRKGRELAENPRAALVLRWDELERQVCVTGAAEPAPEDESDAYFASRPRGAQLAAWASEQSSVIPGRAALEARGAELEKRFAGGEVPRPPHWGGVRVVPDAVEFWQGRPSRLHDRLRFRLLDGAWLVERLSP